MKNIQFFKEIDLKLFFQYERHYLGEDKVLEISYSITKLSIHFVPTEAYRKSNIWIFNMLTKITVFIFGDKS